MIVLIILQENILCNRSNDTLLIGNDELSTRLNNDLSFLAQSNLTNNQGLTCFYGQSLSSALIDNQLSQCQIIGNILRSTRPIYAGSRVMSCCYICISCRSSTLANNNYYLSLCRIIGISNRHLSGVVFRVIRNKSAYINCRTRTLICTIFNSNFTINGTTFNFGNVALFGRRSQGYCTIIATDNSTTCDFYVSNFSVICAITEYINNSTTFSTLDFRVTTNRYISLTGIIVRGYNEDTGTTNCAVIITTIHRSTICIIRFNVTVIYYYITGFCHYTGLSVYMAFDINNSPTTEVDTAVTIIIDT